jgi:predicted  nucleic acid-binding Zn-ribbon protein
MALLQEMVQRVLDEQRELRDHVRLLREDNQAVRRRLSRIEQAMLGLQRALLDRVEGDSAVQNTIDALTARLDRLERKLHS